MVDVSRPTSFRVARSASNFYSYPRPARFLPSPRRAPCRDGRGLCADRGPTRSASVWWTISPKRRHPGGRSLKHLQVAVEVVEGSDRAAADVDLYGRRTAWRRRRRLQSPTKRQALRSCPQGPVHTRTAPVRHWNRDHGFP